MGAIVNDKRNCPDEILISRMLDGELSEEEMLSLREQIAASTTGSEISQRLANISTLVKQASCIELSSREKAAFDTALSRRLTQIPEHSFSFTGWILDTLKAVFSMPWQWQTAGILILVSFCFLPFLGESPTETDGSFIPSVYSDYSGARIFQKTDVAAGYDLIWVVTEEEESEEDDEKPFSLLPFARV